LKGRGDFKAIARRRRRRARSALIVSACVSSAGARAPLFASLDESAAL